MRGPKHVVTKGATPVLTPAETRELLDRIDTETLVGLRDRALLSVMVFSFARVSAAVGMRLQDYFRQGVRGWLRLHEKGGKRHDVPAHHRAVVAGVRRTHANGVAPFEQRWREALADLSIRDDRSPAISCRHSLSWSPIQGLCPARSVARRPFGSCRRCEPWPLAGPGTRWVAR